MIRLTIKSLAVRPSSYKVSSLLPVSTRLIEELAEEHCAPEKGSYLRITSSIKIRFEVTEERADLPSFFHSIDHIIGVFLSSLDWPAFSLNDLFGTEVVFFL